VSRENRKSEGKKFACSTETAGDENKASFIGVGGRNFPLRKYGSEGREISGKEVFKDQREGKGNRFNRRTQSEGVISSTIARLGRYERKIGPKNSRPETREELKPNIRTWGKKRDV